MDGLDGVGGVFPIDWEPASPRDFSFCSSTISSWLFDPLGSVCKYDDNTALLSYVIVFFEPVSSW